MVWRDRTTLFRSLSRSIPPTKPAFPGGFTMTAMNGICRAYLFGFSVYHVFTGMVSMFFPTFAMSFYKGLYGYDPVERKHLVLILKPWGALAFFAGFVGLFCATDPN